MTFRNRQLGDKERIFRDVLGKSWKTQPNKFQLLGHDSDHCLENSSIFELQFSGLEPDRFLENSSKKRLLDFLKIQMGMSFPVIGSAHYPKIKISKKYWMSFPEIHLCQNLSNFDANSCPKTRP